MRGIKNTDNVLFPNWSVLPYNLPVVYVCVRVPEQFSPFFPPGQEWKGFGGNDRKSWDGWGGAFPATAGWIKKWDLHCTQGMYIRWNWAQGWHSRWKNLSPFDCFIEHMEWFPTILFIFQNLFWRENDYPSLQKGRERTVFLMRWEKVMVSIYELGKPRPGIKYTIRSLELFKTLNSPDLPVLKPGLTAPAESHSFSFVLCLHMKRTESLSLAGNTDTTA